MEKIKRRVWVNPSISKDNPIDDLFVWYFHKTKARDGLVECDLEITPIEPEVTNCPLCGAGLSEKFAFMGGSRHDETPSCILSEHSRCISDWQKLAKQVRGLRGEKDGQ